ncbi:MAG TPA: Hsp20/alpha crystallin family protein [Gaiellaceae bacterium]|nr:Hsp20/alpha crystallin family protein [Gaiellaceae bacterium]
MSQLLPERRRTDVPERWEPFQELERVTERMRRVLEETFGGFGWPSLWPSFPREAAAWSPLVDLEEQDDAYVLEAELPGVKRGDVNVELVGNELTITGELKEKERTGTLRRRTRRTGRFDYRVRLPEQVDPDKIEASMAEGVLTVRVPKAERARRKKIEIKG